MLREDKEMFGKCRKNSGNVIAGYWYGLAESFPVGSA
jgi:hypothetical protein